MNFFDLFRFAKMNAEPGAGGGSLVTGGGDAAASAAPAATTDAPAATDALADINSTKTVGELEAEQAGQQQETPEAKAEREAAEAKAKTEVPEAYAEFKIPEGVQADTELLAEFSAVAKELGLTQDQAQKLVDLQAKTAIADTTARQQQLDQALAAQSERWANEIKNDPELGGAKFDSTIATAVKAMQAFGSPELRQLLNDSGIGNHPSMVKLFHSIGTSISEDKIVIPGTDSSTTEKSAAQIMFGDAFN